MAQRDRRCTRGTTDAQRVGVGPFSFGRPSAAQVRESRDSALMGRGRVGGARGLRPEASVAELLGLVC